MSGCYTALATNSLYETSEAAAGANSMARFENIAALERDPNAKSFHVTEVPHIRYQPSDNSDFEFQQSTSNIS